jgi:F-type H+-transporting ATPase subunit delta
LREPTIARNYAEALFQVGERSGDTELFADLMEGLAAAVQTEDRVRHVLESPRVPKKTKQDILARTFAGYAPDTFVRFLGAVVKRGRQGILDAICREYLGLVDDKFNRVHAGVTVAREPDADLQDMIKRRLSVILEKEVIPHYRTDPEILGGLVIRVGDRIMDGSVRRRMAALRRKLLGA